MFCHICGSHFGVSSSFCRKCGIKKWQLFSLPKEATEKESICHYFQRNFSYQSIVSILKKYHGICISVRTVKRRLHDYGLKRRKCENRENVVRSIIDQEITGPSSLIGYRSTMLVKNIETSSRFTRKIDISSHMESLNFQSGNDETA